jgi:hypothetical protein
MERRSSERMEGKKELKEVREGEGGKKKGKFTVLKMRQMGWRYNSVQEHFSRWWKDLDDKTK